MKASAGVISDVLADRGLNNDVDLTNCWSPPLEEPRDTPREDVTTKCLSLQRDETEVKLHNYVLLQNNWNFKLSIADVQRFDEDFPTSDPHGDHLIDKLELDGTIEKIISAHKVVRFAGKTSGLAMRPRNLFSCNTSWYRGRQC